MIGCRFITYPFDGEREKRNWVANLCAIFCWIGKWVYEARDEQRKQKNQTETKWDRVGWAIQIILQCDLVCTLISLVDVNICRTKICTENPILFTYKLCLLWKHAIEQFNGRRTYFRLISANVIAILRLCSESCIYYFLSSVRISSRFFFFILFAVDFDVAFFSDRRR